MPALRRPHVPRRWPGDPVAPLPDFRCGGGTDMSDTGGEEFRQRVRRIEALVETLEQTADPATRAAARELMATLLDLHRAGLARLLEVVGRAEVVAEACADDELIRTLLLLHGLHPAPLEERVLQ